MSTGTTPVPLSGSRAKGVAYHQYALGRHAQYSCGLRADPGFSSSSTSLKHIVK